MSTTSQPWQPDEPRLFPEILGLDSSILKGIGEIFRTTRTEPSIVVCEVRLPPGEVFRVAGVQYGIYLVAERDGTRVIVGMRTERHHGKDARGLVLNVAKVVMSAFTPEVPEIIEMIRTTDFLL